MRAVRGGRDAKLRNPEAVRPWQHVLNPLSGYLLLAQELWRSRARRRGRGTSGRATGDARTVRWIVERLAELWGGAFSGSWTGARTRPRPGIWSSTRAGAERSLGWRPEWGLDEALERMVEWHEARARAARTCGSGRSSLRVSWSRSSGSPARKVEGLPTFRANSGFRLSAIRVARSLPAMSPLTVRRYRAERLLRKDFEGLRGKVLGTVRGRLRRAGEPRRERSGGLLRRRRGRVSTRRCWRARRSPTRPAGSRS